jgi:thiol:disulfide interchange protein
MQQKIWGLAGAGLALGLALAGGCGRPLAKTAQAPKSEISAPGEDAAPARPATQEAAQPGRIEYSTSYEKAMKRARAEGKPVMIDFYTDWCGVCKMMDARVFNQPPVVAEAQKFVAVKVNAERRDDLARTFAVRGYPTFIWLDARGDILDRLDGGMMSEGFLEKMQQARAKFSAPA